ncbi:nitrogenase component 1 [uncultured Desulfobacter sp.]|uniref:nitrogenase component 1 n=1 Tax=uncultured Desulfobacter sp. TaxID=240139 RepID=UPI0029C7B2F1|nr:nitrogenase component 1 [uncultured Desulfobacter sp.]
MTSISVLKQREKQIYQKGSRPFKIECETKSLAGAVSQRACVFCGSRVVLYPIADALHLIHGPIGCASYTWDIRGAQSSGPELHRMSFSTDLSETDIIYGGEKKLKRALLELIDKYSPKAAFIYCTCIVGIIGDDVDAVCRQVEEETRIPVIAVHSEGFKGTKKDGYKAACDALFSLIERNNAPRVTIPDSINILGEFNIGGETWMIKKYYEAMGVKVVSVITGDGRVDEVMQARNAALNVVQCSGSVTHLAKQMQEEYGIPFIRVSYFGIEDTSDALYQVAVFFDKTPDILKKTQAMIKKEVQAIIPRLETMKKTLRAKKRPYTWAARSRPSP